MASLSILILTIGVVLVVRLIVTSRPIEHGGTVEFKGDIGVGADGRARATISLRAEGRPPLPPASGSPAEIDEAA